MTELSEIQSVLKATLRQYKDFPTPGVLFEDIMPIFRSPKTFQMLIDALKIHIEASKEKPDVIVGLDARGFLFGPTLALQLGLPFVPVRKKGKLPGETYEARYIKEYGEDDFVMQKDAIAKGQKVIIVDDIIATGGSAAAAGSLVEQAGGITIEYVFLLELLFLKGREVLKAPIYTLLGDQA